VRVFNQPDYVAPELAIEIAQTLKDLFEDSIALAWATMPNDALGGRTPRQAVSEGDIRLVGQLLGAVGA
jgi:hypothetical protein